MTTAQCSNCFFSFVAPASANTVANNRGATLQSLRFCNRQAPSADAANPNGWLWPQVADDWWCGEGADHATGQAYANTVNGVPGTGGAGPGYLATSTTSLTIASSGSLAPVTQLNLAYTAGARVRLTSTGSGAWMEGIVTNYDALGTLTFTADKSSGSGSHTDWDINIAGQSGGGLSSKGTLTLSAGTTTVVLDANALTTSFIAIMPTNLAAVSLLVGNNPYLSSINNGVSFTLTCSSGAGGTETFSYAIFN